MLADLFQYEVADDDTPANWMLPGFDDLTWGQGQAGFGFSDGDDVTLIDNDNVAVYIRKAFMIPDTSAIAEAILHMDYDDGFIAYLNGTEIARVNMTEMSPGTPTPMAITKRSCTMEACRKHLYWIWIL